MRERSWRTWPCRSLPLVTAGVLAASAVSAPPATAAGGRLDRSFGVDGQVTSTAFFSTGGGSPIAFQGDGKIVVAGYVYNPVSGRSRFAAARFDVAGTLDPTFGGDGIVTTIFRTGTKCYDAAKSVVVQSDGKIVAVGTSSCKRPEPAGFGETDSLFALARYEGDGTPDTTFGGGGTVMTSFGDPARSYSQAVAAALEPDGGIVAAGIAGSRFAVALYDTDGTLDTSFSADGKVTTNFTRQYDKLTDVAVQPDGKIVVGGTAAYWMVETDVLEAQAALARYNLDGALESTFGGDG